MSPLALFLASLAVVFVALLLPARRLMLRRAVHGARGWALRIAEAIALLALSAAIVTSALYQRARRARYDVPLPALTIPDDSASLARGAHLVAILGCTSCHGANLGGTVFFDEPGVARLIAPNLTGGAGGRGAVYTDGEFARAIRFGVRRTGQALYVMPTPEFNSLTDADLAAVVAHLRRVPPVSDTLPVTQIGWLGRFGIATGKYQASRDLLGEAAPRPAAAPTGATVEHGQYLAHAICTECHRALGEVAPVKAGDPPHMNVLGGYELPALTRALREAVAQDGRKLGPMMQSKRLLALTDEEVAALQLYFRSRVGATSAHP